MHHDLHDWSFKRGARGGFYSITGVDNCVFQGGQMYVLESLQLQVMFPYMK